MGHKSISQLQNEMKSKLQDLCPLYARVLMQYSNYSNLVTDKNFFETFYDAISTTMQARPRIIKKKMTLFLWGGRNARD